jgi:hypothetical protein
MAPLEQQWVKVQQKTFTKWCASPACNKAETQLTIWCRLNSKLKTREVQIDDLITDLSDGVSSPEILGSPSLGPRPLYVR